MEKRNLFVSGKAVVAAVCGAFTAAFGWLGWLVVAWAACMALDWVSGSAAAAGRGAWSSAAARAGIWHKAGMVVVVLVCALTDAVLAVAVANLPGLGLEVNGVVLPVGVFSGGAVYSADAKECCKVLKEHGAFAAFPKGAEITKGFLPVGDDEELRSAQDMCRRKIADKHFAAGVSIMDPNNTYIDPRVKIGSGTVILPGTILRGRTVIGKNCTIGPNAMIRDCTVGDETEVNASQLNESTVGAHTTVGPFAYVRPNSKIGDHVKVGDFVEIKNSVIGNGTKISHLTYVGDSDCGERINFGCGTVTTNYDGFKKFRCTIGDDAFIGCNTNLIAPVTVGNGSYIAAGSTITDEVPADSLAIARERQVNKPGWAEQWRAAHEKK